MKPTFKVVYRPYGRIFIKDSIEEKMKLLLVAAMELRSKPGKVRGRLRFDGFVD